APGRARRRGSGDHAVADTRHVLHGSGVCPRTRTTRRRRMTVRASAITVLLAIACGFAIPAIAPRHASAQPLSPVLPGGNGSQTQPITPVLPGGSGSPSQPITPALPSGSGSQTQPLPAPFTPPAPTDGEAPPADAPTEGEVVNAPEETKDKTVFAI